MARHRQPEALAKLKGADKKNPQRYETQTPTSDLPLGNAPAHLSEAAKAVWFEIETYALKGVLTGSDRFVMEIASTLIAEYRSNPPEFKAAKYGHMVSCLARLGLTPADRQKLGTAKPAEGNAFDEF